MKDVVYHNATEKEALEYTSKIVDFGVILCVYVALNELLNAYVVLQHSKLFKQSVKRRAKNALKMRNNKIEQLRNLVMYKDFAECYWDAVIDVSEGDIMRFKEELRITLREAEQEEAELYSQVEAARVLLEAAKIHFEESIKDCTAKFMAKDLRGMKDLNLFNVFSEFYIDDIFREWNIVCDILYSNKNKNIELSNERTVKVFNAIAEKFAKGLYIDECLAVAQKEYPEFSEVKIRITE